MYELTFIRTESVDGHIKRYGGFNDFPPNWKAASEAEIIQGGFTIYTPDYVEFRQMFRTNGVPSSPIISATLYFLPDGSGYAVESDHKNKQFKYYTFADCIHNFGRDKGKRPFHHLYVCEKCGYRKEYDSSG